MHFHFISSFLSQCDQTLVYTTPKSVKEPPGCLSLHVIIVDYIWSYIEWFLSKLHFESVCFVDTPRLLRMCRGFQRKLQQEKVVRNWICKWSKEKKNAHGCKSCTHVCYELLSSNLNGISFRLMGRPKMNYYLNMQDSKVWLWIIDYRVHGGILPTVSQWRQRWKFSKCEAVSPKADSDKLKLQWQLFSGFRPPY